MLIRLPVQSFHIHTRLKGTHPHAAFPDKFDTSNLESREAFEELPTAKLQALVKICLHHLGMDGAPPLVVESDTGKLVVDESVKMPDPVPGAGPDKIVIYTSLPSTNEMVIKVRYHSRCRVS